MIKINKVHGHRLYSAIAITLLLVAPANGAHADVYSKFRDLYERYDEAKLPVDPTLISAGSGGGAEAIARAYCKKNTATCKKIAHKIGDPIFKNLGLETSLIDQGVQAWIDQRLPKVASP